MNWHGMTKHGYSKTQDHYIKSRELLDLLTCGTYLGYLTGRLLTREGKKQYDATYPRACHIIKFNTISGDNPTNLFMDEAWIDNILDGCLDDTMRNVVLSSLAEKGYLVKNAVARYNAAKAGIDMSKNYTLDTQTQRLGNKRIVKLLKYGLLGL